MKHGDLCDKSDNIKVLGKIAQEKSARESESNKLRAPVAFTDNEEEFKGFEKIEQVEDLCKKYRRVIERLEAQILTAEKELKPVKILKVPIQASKRPRKDTDGSLPSSALSSRAAGERPQSTRPSTVGKVIRAGTSGLRGRRPTTDLSSPLLRVPLERGWRRELVYRATLDSYSRRKGDIYYHTPHGKKLRSTREVAEHLSGTGLTVENFSFYDEPLGVDDPAKEIIRNAKRRVKRRVEPPVPAPPPTTTEGKRTPKPKAPKRVNSKTKRKRRKLDTDMEDEDDKKKQVKHTPKDTAEESAKGNGEGGGTSVKDCQTQEEAAVNKTLKATEEEEQPSETQKETEQRVGDQDETFSRRRPQAQWLGFRKREKAYLALLRRKENAKKKLAKPKASKRGGRRKK